MIIGSDVRHEVGERSLGVTDNDAQHHPEQPYLVLAESTRDAWILDARKDGIAEWRIMEALRLSPSAYFYEISVD